MLNVARATLKGLEMLTDIDEMARIRGKSLEEIMPFWMRGQDGDE